MLNVYNLAEAVTVARDGGYAGSNYYDVEPYQFHSDNLFECSAEMAHAVMTEAVEMNECFTITEEIMSEAATENPEVLDVLAEATFQSVMEGVKKFFDKIVAFVTGIIDKLKAYFAKTTGNVDKWLTIMKPRVQATMGNQSDWKSVTVEMWTYDEKYINTGMPGALKNLTKAWLRDVGGRKKTPLRDILKNAKGIQKTVDRTNGDAPPAKMDSRSDAAIKALNAQTEAAKQELAQKQKAFVGNVASALGVSAKTSLDAIWSECGLKAHGGKTQRVSQNVGGRVDSMLSSLEGSKEAIKGITDAYDSHLKDLQAYRKSLNDAALDVTGGDATPPPVVNAGRACLSAEQNIATTMTSLYEKVMNRAKDLNLAYAREMCKEYMNALTKFAGHKAAKD